MIYVLGSINKDLSLEVGRMPKKGETITADSCTTGMGGKGAIQAAVIARLGKRTDDNRKVVRLIGRVGDDAAGVDLKNTLNECGVDTEFVHTARRNTGLNIVSITPKDSRSVYYAGANNVVSKTDVDEALEGAGSNDTLLCQLETPLYVVAYALRKARSLGMTTILTPSPANKQLPEDLFYNVDIVVPNETETQKITGVNPTDFEAQKSAMRWFHARGVQYVAITLGANGVTLSDGGKIVAHIPGRKSPVLDASGAGDTFVGALTLTYPHIGMYSFREACEFANRAASLSVTRRGAAESIPSLEEVLELYNNVIE